MTIDEQITCKETITARRGFYGPVGRDQIIANTGASIPLPLANFRIWNAFGTLLGTASADDLGINDGTFGTSGPSIRSSDMNAAGAVTQYARTTVQLPIEYEAGAAVSLRFAAGMLTSVAATSATVDVEIHKVARDLTVGADLVTTAATTINSITLADKDFVITPTGFAPGDVFDIRIALILNSATASSHFGVIAAVELITALRG